MSDSKPSLLPGGSPSAGGAKTAAGAPAAPSALPPGAAASGGKGRGTVGAAGKRTPPAGGASTSLQAPSLRPGSSGAAGAVTATWQSNVHVIGLWSINQDRNCWAYLDTVGWRNLSGASESGLVAMNMLAAHAYQLGSASSLYEEDDGRISQLYVW
jgi:hypothetical protein